MKTTQESISNMSPELLSLVNENESLKQKIEYYRQHHKTVQETIDSQSEIRERQTKLMEEEMNNQITEKIEEIVYQE